MMWRILDTGRMEVVALFHNANEIAIWMNTERWYPFDYIFEVYKNGEWVLPEKEDN